MEGSGYSCIQVQVRAQASPWDCVSRGGGGWRRGRGWGGALAEQEGSGGAGSARPSREEPLKDLEQGHARVMLERSLSTGGNEMEAGEPMQGDQLGEENPEQGGGGG